MNVIKEIEETYMPLNKEWYHRSIVMILLEEAIKAERKACAELAFLNAAQSHSDNTSLERK
jgi:hypothetical protein